jgi:hypothetical protein
MPEQPEGVNLKGRVIVESRVMSPDEQEAEGWDEGTIVLVLDDGTRIFAARDEESNGPGALIVYDAEGHGHMLLCGYKLT